MYYAFSNAGQTFGPRLYVKGLQSSYHESVLDGMCRWGKRDRTDVVDNEVVHSWEFADFDTMRQGIDFLLREGYTWTTVDGLFGGDQ